MTAACHEWRGELAARALGVRSNVGAALDAHLDGCPGCRAELADLRATADALALADPERSGVPDPGPALADQIVERIEHERTGMARRRRRRLIRAAAVAAAAAAVLTVAVVWAGDGEDGRAGIELAGTDGSSGSALLSARPWGTEVILDVTGLDEGEVYWLWLTDAGGQRVTAGTITGTGDAMHAVLASAVPASEAARIWMTDEDDRVVLDAVIVEG